MRHSIRTINRLGKTMSRGLNEAMQFGMIAFMGVSLTLMMMDILYGVVKNSLSHIIRTKDFLIPLGVYLLGWPVLLGLTWFNPSQYPGIILNFSAYFVAIVVVFMLTYKIILRFRNRGNLEEDMF